MIEYREAKEECRKAWFEYKELMQGQAVSCVDFVAGWNAAKGWFKEKAKDLFDQLPKE